MKHSLTVHATPSFSQGFTLIEALVVIVILSLLLSLASPSVTSMIDKQRVRGTCESIYQNLALARSSAVSLNTNVTFRLQNSGTNQWCVGLSTTSGGCDCAASPGNCLVNSIQRIASYTDFSGSSIVVTNSESDPIVFSARDNAPSEPADITVASNKWACKLGLEALGQVKYYKTGTGTKTRAVVPAGEVGGLY